MDIKMADMDTPSDGGEEAYGPSLAEQERQLEQIWSEQDRHEHHQKMRAFEETIVSLRSRIDPIRVPADTLWDQFVSLALEKILKQQLEPFLERLQLEAEALNVEMTETSNGMDTLLAKITEYQRTLDDKVKALGIMAHPISTENHLSMMISRVVGLEAYLLGKQPGKLDTHENHLKKRDTTVPNDLLYLRVRLVTTRFAVIAAQKCKQVADTALELHDLLARVERLKAELTIIMTRMACFHDQTEYWSAFMAMPNDSSFTSPSDDYFDTHS